MRKTVIQIATLQMSHFIEYYFNLILLFRSGDEEPFSESFMLSDMQVHRHTESEHMLPLLNDNIEGQPMELDYPELAVDERLDSFLARSFCLSEKPCDSYLDDADHKSSDEDDNATDQSVTSEDKGSASNDLPINSDMIARSCHQSVVSRSWCSRSSSTESNASEDSRNRSWHSRRSSAELNGSKFSYSRSWHSRSSSAESNSSEVRRSWKQERQSDKINQVLTFHTSVKVSTKMFRKSPVFRPNISPPVLRLIDFVY